MTANSELPLLGVDIGTSATKAVVTTATGRVLARASREHGVALPAPGHVEHDAETIWWSDLRAVVAELQPYFAGGLEGVCISGIGPCVLAADEDGRPLRPAILYGIDTRASEEIDELHARMGERNIFERCGAILTSQAVGPKLVWLRRHEPDVWRKTAKLLMASSYAVHRLTGEYVLDHHSASQCTPLYDIRTGDWIAEWAEEIAPGLALPRLLWSGELAGRVTASGAQASGIPAGTPVAGGTIDAWAEALSAGVRRPGDLMLMYGTTMFFVLAVDGLLLHPKAWATRGLFPATYTLAGGMATSGALTSWFRTVAGDVEYGQLLTEAAATPAGSDGVVVLPYFAGERTPLFDPDARGVICGLTLRHTRGHLYRSLLESTAYGVRHNLETLLDGGTDGVRLVGVGGGTTGRLWPQIVSDVTGLPQQLAPPGTGASYGDAFLAGLAAGIVREDDEWALPGERVEPAESRAIYDELYPIYRGLYPSTLDAAHALARIQNKERR